MSGYMAHEILLRVTGPDGAVQWVGIGPLGVVYEVMIVSQAVAAGIVIVADPSTTIIPRPDYLATESAPKQLLRGLIGGVSTTQGATLGVSIDACASDAAGVQIRVAGVGSIVAVAATANGTAGQYCDRGAAGAVTPISTVTALIQVGYVAKVGNLSGGTGTKLGMKIGI